jgi:UDP-N-acetylenolpyruvoylglucosamine reductase
MRSLLKLALCLAAVMSVAAARADVPYPWEQPPPRVPYSLLVCPLVAQSGHCGNKRCEWLLGETESSCPMDCSKALVQTWNAGVQCSDADELVRPTNVAEVEELVNRARNARRKVRANGRNFSNTDVVCSPDMAISTSALDDIVGIETFEGEETLHVEAGASLDEAMRYLAARGRALVGFPTPIIRPATVGGALATSSHSSSPSHPAIMTDVVASVEVVNWLGQTVLYSHGRSSEAQWKAATANLGLLGVMTRVRLKVRDEKSLHMRASIRPEAEIFSAADPIDLVDGCDYGQFWWNPVAKSFLHVCGHETEAAPNPSADNALNEVLFGTLKNYTEGPGVLISGAFELAGCSNTFRCQLRNLVTKTTLTDPDIFTVVDGQGKRQFVSEATGYSHRMITSDFDGFAGIRTRFLEVVIPPRHRKAALEAIRDYYATSTSCELYSVYNVRFVPILGSSWVGNTAAEGDYTLGDVAMFVEINGYYPKGMDAEHMPAFDRYNDGLVRLLIEQFGARPHWGKGEHWYHQYARELGVRARGLEAFNAVLEKADPTGMFGNAFTRDAGFRSGASF